MGYPMTWRRLINRNHLSDGDYQKPPEFWRRWKSVIAPDYARDPVTLSGVLAHYDAQVESANERMASFAGDLRRFEKDALDEESVCRQIAIRTGLDRDDVAAVLKEFFEI